MANAKIAVYFRISEAARMLDISPSCLRNWERMGLIKAARSQGRQRLYSRVALEELKKIKYLRSVQHVNPAGIVAMLRDNREQEPSGPMLIAKRAAIAHKLRQLRRRRGLTLAQVAKGTGVSLSSLSLLERGNSNASIVTLQKLARLYETNVLAFLVGEDGSRRLVRAGNGTVFVPNPGVRMELLAPGKKAMEPHLLRITPGASSGSSDRHEGEEFIYVLQGKLELWLDEMEHYLLESGDSLYFESRQAHRWQSLSDNETLLLWINAPAF